MRRVHVSGTLAVLLVTVPALAGDVTVGRFLTELAGARQLAHRDAASAEAGLRAAGFDMPLLRLDKALIEGDVAAISGALGLKVTTSRPASPVTESQMRQFMASFGIAHGAQPQINGGGTGGIDPGNSGNGKGKKKGHNKSQSEPI